MAAVLRTRIDGGGGAGGGLPTLIAQPALQIAVLGGSATFSVGATSATPLTYQWRQDGNEIAGATNAVFTRTGIQAANAGSYDVQVGNAAGSVVSNPATLTVSAPVAPLFTTQPVPQTVLAGSTLAFTAVATGVPGPTLQWFKGAEPIPGATATTLTLANVQPADAVTYFAVATSSAGSATSLSALLTVNPAPPTIATPPASQSVPLGGSATLSVVASGTAPFAYQWRKNGMPMATASTSSLSLTNVQATDGGSYDVVVDNPANAPASSAPAALVVGTTPVAPGILTSPVAQTVPSGASATFTVVATSTNPLAYQWRKSGVPLSDGAGVSGASTATLVLSGVGPAQIGSYDVVVSNGTLPNASRAPA